MKRVTATITPKSIPREQGGTITITLKGDKFVDGKKFDAAVRKGLPLMFEKIKKRKKR